MSHLEVSAGYGSSSLIFGLQGGILMLLVRLSIISGPSVFRIVTIHALLLLLWVVIGYLFNTGSNSLLPIVGGVQDFIAPRFNVLRLVMFVVSGISLTLVLQFLSGLGSGWVFSFPLVLFNGYSFIENVIGATLLRGVASVLLSLNIIATVIVASRALQCTLLMEIYSLLAAVLLLILPALIVGLALMLAELLGISSVLTTEPLIFQELFWIFGHPEVYVLLLPSLALCRMLVLVRGFTLISVEGMLRSVIVVLGMGFAVMGHHLFTLGLEIDVLLFYSLLTYLIAIPTSVKVIRILCRSLETNSIMGVNLRIMLTVVFVLGGVMGITLASVTLDGVFHDTQAVVGHFHLVLAVRSLISIVLLHSLVRNNISLLTGLVTIEGVVLLSTLFIRFITVGIENVVRRRADFANLDYNFRVTLIGSTLLLLLGNNIFRTLTIELNRQPLLFPLLGSVGNIYTAGRITLTAMLLTMVLGLFAVIGMLDGDLITLIPGSVHCLLALVSEALILFHSIAISLRIDARANATIFIGIMLCSLAVIVGVIGYIATFNSIGLWGGIIAVTLLGKLFDIFVRLVDNGIGLLGRIIITLHFTFAVITLVFIGTHIISHHRSVTSMRVYTRSLLFFLFQDI
eukprot:GHVN01001351.1.p1 GENE.GHVN01001351.1~~GHVN01001351.1.p1  ORF type:complete len:628 (-),score=-93.87 GHVN01001351.1:3544-5427(-)